ncbi:MAG: hypothetical protein SCALA702_05250 [Melioribacteraceae bacterium]|nr:MAG: hypothetical protein SCALA702_05250 [Melioribacteraceae bacterium]
MAATNQKYQILLLEDDHSDALLIKNFLSKAEENFYVTHFFSIGELLKSGADQFHLILLDLNLPDYKEFAGLELILEKFPSIPVVILTADKNESTAINALRLGAQDFLHKGDFDWIRLKETILFSLERKRIEKNFKQKVNFISEEKLLKNLMDNIPDSIYFKDIRSKFIKVNNSTLKKFGFDNESELLGKSDLDLFGEAHGGAAYGDEQNIIRTGKPIIAKVEKEDWKDGSITWVSTTKLPLYNENGEITGTFGITRDITKQKQIEENYKQTRDYNELLLRIVPSAIFTVDKSKKITSWNDKAEEITGYKREEILGKPCSFFANEPCISTCGLFDGKIVDSTSTKECTIISKSGKEKTILKNIELIKDKDGNAKSGVETFIDITDLKEAEKKLSQSEKQFRSVWEHANEGMRITDENGIILMVNDAYCRMVRKTPEELTGQKFNVVFSNEDEEAVEKYIQKFKLNRIVPRLEKEIQLWDKSRFWFSIFSSHIELNDNRKALLSVFRDVTEAKKSEIIQNVIFEINNAIYEISDFEKLLEKIHKTIGRIVKAESFFIALYNKENNTIDIPYSIDEEGKEKDLPIEGTFTGYVIKTRESLLVDDEESMQMVIEGKTRIVGKPSKIWLGVPITLNDEVFGVVVTQDYNNRNAIGIEEQVMVEYVSDQIGLALERIISRRKLIASEKKLREANDAKDRFFSIISHDLRNPFITLDSFLKMLSEDYDQFSEDEKKEYLNILHKTSQRTLSLLDNLLTWSRSQRGVLKINKERQNLKKLSEEAISPLINTAEKKKIGLIIPLDEHIYLEIDRFMLETVIRNLISNAIKFTEPGGTITLSAEQDEQNTRIRINDTGVGMDEKTVSELFRVDVSHTSLGTSNEEGTGLGLILCKEFVEKNGGTISVNSEKGKGSTFTLVFPL